MPLSLGLGLLSLSLLLGLTLNKLLKLLGVLCSLGGESLHEVLMALIALSILVDTLVHLLTYPVALLSLLHLCDVDVVWLDE